MHDSMRILWHSFFNMFLKNCIEHSILQEHRTKKDAIEY